MIIVIVGVEFAMEFKNGITIELIKIIATVVSIIEFEISQNSLHDMFGPLCLLRDEAIF